MSESSADVSPAQVHPFRVVNLGVKDFDELKSMAKAMLNLIHPSAWRLRAYRIQTPQVAKLMDSPFLLVDMSTKNK